MTDIKETARDLFVDEERPDGELRSAPTESEVLEALREAKKHGAARAIGYITRKAARSDTDTVDVIGGATPEKVLDEEEPVPCASYGHRPRDDILDEREHTDHEGTAQVLCPNCGEAWTIRGEEDVSMVCMDCINEHLEEEDNNGP